MLGTQCVIINMVNKYGFKLCYSCINYSENRRDSKHISNTYTSQITLVSVLIRISKLPVALFYFSHVDYNNSYQLKSEQCTFN